MKATPERQAVYENFKYRKGANTAKVAMARQMLKIIYHVLKEKGRIIGIRDNGHRYREKSSRWPQGSEVSRFYGVASKT